jgi:hypothetical protein
MPAKSVVNDLSRAFSELHALKNLSESPNRREWADKCQNTEVQRKMDDFVSSFNDVVNDWKSGLLTDFRGDNSKGELESAIQSVGQSIIRLKDIQSYVYASEVRGTGGIEGSHPAISI